MNVINLKLTVDEINIILEALGQQPYVKVSQLIGSIHQQAQAQLQQAGDQTPDQLGPADGVENRSES